METDQKIKPKCTECEKPSRKRGMCSTHYSRWRNSVGSVPCTVDNCPNRAHGKGLCYKHRSRLERIGSTYLPTGYSERPGLSYRGVHARVVKAKGKASEHACVDCGNIARDWSLNKDCDYEMIQAQHQVLPVSYDVDNYEPRCKSCHIRYDLQNRTFVEKL